ncbi:MAG: S41 family peptidase [Streptosporangiaceae bacterium]
MSRLAARLVRGISIVAVLALVYGGGVLTGVVGSGGAGPDDGRNDGPEDGVVDQAADEIMHHAAHPASREKLRNAAVGGMLDALHDPWSRYYTPSEYHNFRSVLSGRYSGVGVWLERTRDGRIVVSSVQPGSPAAGAELAPGDEIVRVGPRTVRGGTLSSAVASLRGSPQTTVTLTVRRPGDQPGDSRTDQRTLSLTRADLPTRDVNIRHVDGVLLIKVSEFTRGVGRRVRRAVRQAPPSGIILDLRANPGGLLSEAVETASAFLGGGPVVSYARRGEGRRDLYAVGDGDTTTPLVVLVDGRTASAAEVVAGALQDRGRAVLVGSRTFGKGSVQEAHVLQDGSALELTVGHYFLPSGRSIDGAGIEPDVLVARGSPRKAAVRRAVDVLSGLLAALPSAKERG